MKVTLTLPNARVYGVADFMVKSGERFELKLVPENGEVLPENLKWFSNNDPVLNMWTDTNGLGSALESKEVGNSDILIMDTDLNIKKKLTVSVVLEIPEEAEVLEISTEVLPK